IGQQHRTTRADDVHRRPEGQVEGRGYRVVLYDKVGNAGHPVTLRIAAGTQQICVGGRGISLNRENHQLVSAVRAVFIPQIFQHVVGVEKPAGAAPGGENVEDHDFPAIQVVVQAVFDTIDVGDGDVRHGRAVGKLRLGVESESQQEQEHVKYLHEESKG